MEYRLRQSDLSIERLDGEIIAIDFLSGKYGSFIGPSADVLWLVQLGVPRKNWVKLLEDSFVSLPGSEELESDVDAFLQSMADLGIIEPAGELDGMVDSLPADYVRGIWTPPVYAIEDDLVDLLVIDPIHDTSDDGWPQAAPQ
ncbi:unannotated protein [freshwater metagenome]|uniref:Unannotated protein n=1 Tax=freshwater metagenome TaxID=449393 RepID=A0A6J6ETL6_9ZZZZ|nr:hypothetical protein [Actinomycetota bacterium]